MKVNVVILPQAKTKGKLHTCPNCGSENWIEHFNTNDESEPYDAEQEYHWYCLDCNYKDYDYIIF